MIDNRVRAAQVMSTGGPSVQEAAKKALRDGSPKAVAAFLQTGQYTARQIDERVQAAQLLAGGGPEVQAAAKFALSGTPELVHDFLQSGQYMADRKDQLAATHAAQMRQLISEASQTAAKAQQNAWEATEAAAVASNASAAADEARAQARTSADQAAGFATSAGQSAKEAEGSAARAAKFATTARTASQAAARDASKATSAAARAQASAIHARWSAGEARMAAADAFASSQAAGKDATQAQQAADQAWGAVAEKAFQERAAVLKSEEANTQADIKRLEDEFTKELEEALRAEIESAAKEQSKNKCNSGGAFSPAYTTICVFMKGGNKAVVVDTNEEYNKALKEVFKAFVGIDTAEECVKQKSVSACAETAVSFFPAGKAAKLAELLKKARNVEDVARTSRFSRAGETAVEQCLLRDSFPAGTRVLMADGSTRPIEQIRIGDHVRATAPESGETSSRRVDATIYTPDDQDFTDLTVESASAAPGTITSTAHHPFWVENRQAWQSAADLKIGDTVRTDTGQAARIVAANRWSALQPAYNLTVNTVHTYYVLAGDTPLLVHNSLCQKEKTVDGLESFEQARNAALKLLGDIDPASRQPYIGRLETAGTTYGKVVGFTTRVNGEFKRFRLDFDPVKGPHINVEIGKGESARKWAVPWPGTEEDFARIIGGNS
ncbi:polymorphic toxin-type HINT domain-containing protein [Kitasatospora sp. NPDC058063]|uniref:polymorphic toxin-type HINT domain-containing protein n=1 Tax=unclassified Kitasatospora TaxID=2633591 RepID=UPI0036D82D6E